MTMTLEQVRDWHRRESWLCNSHKCVFGADATHKAHWAGKEKLHGAMADAIDAHLTQPAQSVDVEKVREVIAELSNPAVLHAPYVTRCADKLTAALQEKGKQ